MLCYHDPTTYQAFKHHDNLAVALLIFGGAVKHDEWKELVLLLYTISPESTNKQRSHHMGRGGAATNEKWSGRCGITLHHLAPGVSVKNDTYKKKRDILLNLVITIQRGLNVVVVHDHESL